MPGPTYESEWLTRKKRIDTRLRALGWEIAAFVDTRTKPYGVYYTQTNPLTLAARAKNSRRI